MERSSACTPFRQAVILTTNFFPVKLEDNDRPLQKFAVFYTPEIPESMEYDRMKLFNLVRPAIYSRMGRVIFGNNAVYSCYSGQTSEKTFEVSRDGIDYTIALRPVALVHQHEELLTIYKRLINCAAARAGLTKIRDRFYDFLNRVEVKKRGVSICSGYYSSVSNYEGGLLLNINTANKVIRSESVLSDISAMCNQQRERSFIDRKIVGLNVITVYNRLSYRVDSIDWDKSPLSTFVDNLQQETTFVKYYESRGIVIRDLAQPLLTCVRRDNTIYLIPELCVATGLSKEEQTDYGFICDVRRVLHQSPSKKLQECQKLVSHYLLSDLSAGYLNEWRVSFDNKPIDLVGYELPELSINVGENVSKVVGERFDREAQAPPYIPVSLDRWAVFYESADTRSCRKFLSVFKQAMGMMKIRFGKEKYVEVPSHNWEDWETSLTKTLDAQPETRVIICILAHRRDQSHYGKIKRLVLSKYAVVSQLILSRTLTKASTMLSICHKVLIQIIAKLGGVPWALTSVPLLDRPTMVIGIEETRSDDKFALAICGTVNRSLSNYASAVFTTNEGEVVASKLKLALRQLLQRFLARNNGVRPERFVLYKSGLSTSMREYAAEQDVPQLRSVIDELQREGSKYDPTITYFVVNKRTNARFFLTNPNQRLKGRLCVKDTVVKQDKAEFYLVSTELTSVPSLPTHFHLLYDDSNLPFEELTVFTDQLCYLYFNWTGAIRVPAPCMYAMKLALFARDVMKNTQPHNHWKNTVGLFFI